MQVKAPAARPCGSCPYRQDCPSGLWDASEYAKLPEFDKETFDQPPTTFSCHQQTGRICGGWAGTHDMDASLGLRLAALRGDINEQDLQATRDYESPVPLFATGAQAAAHGMRDLTSPGDKATRAARKLLRKPGVTLS